MCCNRRLLLLILGLGLLHACVTSEEIQSDAPESMSDLPNISEDDLENLIAESRKEVESEESNLSDDEDDAFRTFHRKQSDEREAKKRALLEKTVDIVTQKLRDTLGLKSDNDLKKLSDIKQSLFKRVVCPTGPAPASCNAAAKFRTVNGVCNNLQHTLWGSSFTPYERLIPADYADKVSRAWELRSQVPLPNARYVSTRVFFNRRKLDKSLTDMSMIWGQFLAHDILHSQQPKTTCHLSCFDQGEEACFGINVPCRDRKLPPSSCIPLKRDVPAPLACTNGVREQLNGLTAFIDASGVYGDTAAQAASLRSGCGLIKMISNPNGHSYKDLLPPSTKGYCRSRHSQKCFKSGDGRTNENAGLSSMHIIFAREHNRIVKELKTINPGWDCERLYQEARKIIGAIHQHITYNEYLPEILDPATMTKYNLRLTSFSGYNDKTNPGISNSFSTATFRFGHSQIREVIDRYGKRNGQSPNIPSFLRVVRLRPIQMDRFFDPDPVYDQSKGGCDSIMRGLARKRSEGVDGNFAKAVQHKLQTGPGGKGDLPAINTHRGRDHGLPTYNRFRQLCGLKVAQTFDDFSQEIKSKIVRNKLRSLYGIPENVDLFVGAILENLVPGGAMGATFSCLMGKQFQALREGDRFWYENTVGPQAFTAAQLNELKKASLARVICDNSDGIRRLQPFVQKAARRSNRVTWCAHLPTIDLKQWKESSNGRDPTIPLY